MAEFEPYSSFSEYLKKYPVSGSKPSSPSSSYTPNFKFEGASIGGREGSIPNDPLSWLVDMISRPLYSVTESVDSVLESGERGIKAREKLDETGDTLGFIGDMIGNTVHQATAPMRGFTSTDRSDKRLFSELIEKGTDTFGKSLDPTYEDREDNVNPVLKGTLGFAGDVLLDPINVVPGWLLAKGLGKVGSGVKSVMGLPKKPKAERIFDDINENPVDAASRATDDALREAMEESVSAQATAKMPASVSRKEATWAVPVRNGKSVEVKYFKTRAEALAATKQLKDMGFKSGWKGDQSYRLVSKSKFNTLPKAKSVPAAAKTTGKIDDATSMAAKGVDEAPSALGDLMRAAPRHGEVASALREILRPVAAAEKAAEATMTAGGKKLNEQDWALSYLQKGNDEATIPLFDYQSKKVIGKMRLADLRKNPDFQKHPDVFIDDELLMRWLKPSYKRYLAGEIDETANIIPKNKRGQKPKVGSAKKAEIANDTSFLTAYQSRYATDAGREELENSLGTALASHLAKMRSHERFEQGVKELLRILEDTGDLQALKITGQFAPLMNKLFDRLNIDPVAAQGAYAAHKAATIPPRPTTAEVSEMVESLGTDYGAASSVIEDVSDILPKFIERKIIFPQDRKVFPHLTDNDVPVTEVMRGEGFAVKFDEMNTHTYLDLHQGILKKLQDRIDGPMGADGNRIKSQADPEFNNLYGQARADALKNEYMVRLELIESVLDAHGVPKNIDFIDTVPLKGGSGVEYVPHYVQLSELDVLKELNKHNPELLSLILFNSKTPVPVTKLLEAVALTVRQGDEGAKFTTDIETILTSINKRPDREATGAGNEIANFLHPSYQSVKDAGLVGNKITGGKDFKSEKVFTAPEEVLAGTLKMIEDSAPALRDLAREGAEKYAAEVSEQAVRMDTATMNTLYDLTQDKALLVEALEAFGDLTKLTTEISRKQAIRGTPTTLADTSVKAKVNEATRETSKAKVKTAKAVREGDEAAIHAERKAEFNKAATMVDDVSRETVENYDASGKVYAQINGWLHRNFDFLGRAFNKHHNMRIQTTDGDVVEVGDLLHRAGVNQKHLLTKKIVGLNELARKYGGLYGDTNTSIIVAAFQYLKAGDGIPATADPALRGAYDELMEYISDLFLPTAKGQDAILGNAFFRDGYGVDHINRNLLQFDVLGKGPNRKAEDYFDLAKAAEEAAKAGSDDILSFAAEQWRSWDIADPLDFISRVNAAAIKMATDVGVAQSFERMMIQEGLAAYKPRSGYVKLTATSDTTYLSMLSPGLHVHPEVAQAYHRMEQIASETMKLHGDWGKIVNKYYDPVLNAWKFAITMPRPGHHVRNFVGDQSMTFLALGARNFIKGNEDAFKMMSLHNKYEGFDAVRALNHLEVHNLPTGSTPMASVKLSGGKKTEITYEEVYQAASENGLLVPAQVVEDLFDSEISKSALSTVLNKVTLRGTGVERLASKVSEARDHQARLAHFAQFIRTNGSKARYKNVDDLYRAAARDVKKWHPDVTMLTTFESKYMRRLIPFYSWFRGALPAVLESVVVNPGRVNVFNKASYNLAVSMGVNPDSLHDPFPTDQLFPSFLTEQMTGPQFEGPDGNYYRVNPGIASWDVLNSLLAGPDVGEGVVRGVAGMTSPILRTPLELLGGGSWGTGARINDASDYIDATIPGVNYLANFTGFSPTGSVASLLAGDGLDPQLQHERGNKGPSDQAWSAFNWLTGLGVQNQSRPNYVNMAEIEKRNRARDR